ncbi:MAG: HTTM domain-containing protein [Crocinitomicaceae bacterium]|nr:HTTM domain-containing protein [Crocinitomicaceae bacterium]
MNSVQLSDKILIRILQFGGIVWLIGYFIIYQLFEGEQQFGYQLLLSKLALLIGISVIIVWVIRQLPAFFQEKGSPYNLAVFRIIFFGFFTIGFIFYWSKLMNTTMNFVDLPLDTRVSLPGMQWLINIIPVSKPIVQGAIVLFGLGSLFSFLGFKSRWSMLVFVLAGLYIFGIPNLYGKINHNHHIVWFAALLAFSPCSDVLSIDARLTKQKVLRPGKSYARPFRFMWILMAIIYFFPGFWKAWSCGLDWALTDNVRNQMYWKWYELGDWIPMIRIDQFPILYKSMGLYTLAFELLFIVFILKPKTRIYGFLAAILFHIGTHLFMNIFFVVLVISFASFINWERLLFNRKKYAFPELASKRRVGLKWVGTGLIIINLVFGMGKIFSYPFSVYPTFDVLVEPYTETLSFRNFESEEGLDKEVLRTQFTSERYRNMEHQIIMAFGNDALQDKTALLETLSRTIESDLNVPISISIDKISVIPENKNEVVSSKIIYSTDSGIVE